MVYYSENGIWNWNWNWTWRRESEMETASSHPPLYLPTYAFNESTTTISNYLLLYPSHILS